MEDPVSTRADGIKIKPADMIIDKLYHCIFENKLFLFYRDVDGLLHCYEVENPEAVREISENPLGIETILKKYSRE